LDRIAGLKLAKKLNSDLIPSKPFSGLLSEGRLSHDGPPTAPKSIASLSLAISKVAFGRGSPVSS